MHKESIIIGRDPHTGIYYGIVGPASLQTPQKMQTSDCRTRRLTFPDNYLTVAMDRFPDIVWAIYEVGDPGCPVKLTGLERSNFQGTAFSVKPEFAADVPEKPQGAWFLNEYECDCGESWTDEWDCGVDDECPDCGADCSPIKSTQLH